MGETTGTGWKLTPAPPLPDWWGDSNAAHGVTNLTNPSPDDDSIYNADAFVRFIESLDGAPFLAQISFHNCHIPFVGTPSRRAACNNTAPGAECEPPLPGSLPYNAQELDFYACVSQCVPLVLPLPCCNFTLPSPPPLLAQVA